MKVTIKKTPMENMWFFFNNCRAGRTYKPRDVKKELLPPKPRPTVECSHCHEITDAYRYAPRYCKSSYHRNPGNETLCMKCYNEALEQIVNENVRSSRLQAAESASKFEEYLDRCEELGTCDIIRAHHEALSEDPERLTSEFLIKMVCGEEKLKRYITPIREEDYT